MELAPSPALIMSTLNAYQQTYALRAAIELELFTHIGAGAVTPAALAARAQASERGARILCDYLVVLGYLTKVDGMYGLTPAAATFLDRRSPAYLGTAARFLANDAVVAQFADMAGIVRRGGSGDTGTLGPNDPIWVEFARSMAPMIAMQAQMIAPRVTVAGRPSRVLDIAAGHGLFGIEIARVNRAAQIVAVDWANVLDVARENAAAAGVADRYETIPGSAFDVDFGTGFDLVLLPNFLHHFDSDTNVRLLRKVRAALTGSGIVATVEFVPNADRVSPAGTAAFSLTMLGSTPNGDAYTFAELDQMFREAGFGESRLQPLDPTPQQLIITRA